MTGVADSAGVSGGFRVGKTPLVGFGGGGSRVTTVTVEVGSRIDAIISLAVCFCKFVALVDSRTLFSCSKANWF